MHDYLLTFYRPAAAMRLLLSKQNFLKLGFFYIIIPIFGYTLMYVLLTEAHAAPSVFSPWLNIPKENYYAVNRFLLAPSLILCWFIAAAFIHFVSKKSNDSGNFKQTLSVIALSISIAMWFGLLHDLPMSIFSAIGIIDAREHEVAMNSPTIYRTILWICYSIYFFAFVSLFSISVKVVYRIKYLKCFLVGFSAFCIFQLLFLVFNR